ncbi:alpha-amylase family protein [Frigoribacterium faeni]|uniref:Alpha-amylase n=1 Tax=Frigoribacterium faeni TaxID=145483 RepID=A0A7W3JHR2_9MICO|nr:alpha-amylase family protein [Frigoribacterium faeni]MBA8813092.1 trehalose synthase [Frigoribacterium faeni]GEK83396.1 alpha-amylase [Frigoribacterium faeni]
MRVTDTSDLWWKTAVFYNLDVETYLDWNDDGVGDLEGLAHRLDHLAELGVTCLWLAPFYPSPQQDNGYDISDYYGVDPRYGHLGDFVEVVRTANDRGMRVIVDLVVNHTSDQHPWFQAARSDPSSRFRDYYQWRDDVPDDQPENMFPDVEDGVWSFDEAAGQYYRHSFYSHQPDLATDRQEVRDEIAKVIGFWLQLGIDGFRVDAVPHLIDTDEGAEHGFLQALRGYVSRRSGNGMMLGEVNLPYDEMVPFFGADDGDELTMQFDFVANQALYLSLARQDATPLATALAARPALARGNQWGNFVRNHDELTLDQLSDDERDEVFEAFAPLESQRIHGRGIVRRLPPMLDGDPRRIRMVYSLMFSTPGAPVLFYGEEIGMGENPAVSGRGAVRTPMQWTDETGGGFSRADADDLVAPLADEGWAPEHVNVSRQRHEPDSMLRFVQDLIRHYRSSPEIGWGELTLLASGHDCVLAHAVVSSTGTLVAVHNFAPDGRSVDLDLSGLLGAAAGDGGDAGADAPRLVDLLAERSTPEAPADDGHHRIELEGYGFRWLRVLRADEKRLV